MIWSWAGCRLIWPRRSTNHISKTRLPYLCLFAFLFISLFCSLSFVFPCLPFGDSEICRFLCMRRSTVQALFVCVDGGPKEAQFPKACTDVMTFFLQRFHESAAGGGARREIPQPGSQPSGSRRDGLVWPFQHSAGRSGGSGGCSTYVLLPAQVLILWKTSKHVPDRIVSIARFHDFRFSCLSKQTTQQTNSGILHILQLHWSITISSVCAPTSLTYLQTHKQSQLQLQNQYQLSLV